MTGKGLVFAGILAVATAAVADAATGASRLFMNEDAWHFWIADSGVAADMKRDNVTAMKPGIGATRKGLEAYIDEIARGKVTHFLMNVNGQRANFPSKVLEPVWKSLEEPERDHEEWVRTLKRLADGGIDPYQVWIDRCRVKGVSPWISIRMNDLHRTANPRCPNISTLWRKHPELQINPGCEWDNGLDYSKPAVRKRMLDFIREVLARYDVDGLELDLIRFVRYLPKGRERELAPVFTAFMRDIRKIVDASAAKRGHRIDLSARVMAYPRDSQTHGLQVDVWSKEGLVDFVMPCNFYMNIRYDISADAWRRWIGDRAEVIPGADSGVMKDGKRCLATLDEYRRWAAAMRRNGAKGGYYLYNLFGHPQDGEVWNGVLTDGLDVEAKPQMTRAEAVTFENARMRLVVGDNACVTSLVLKATGEELLDLRDATPFFSVTQQRPFNNEIKLVNPHRRTTYPANRIRREGNRVVVGFDTAPYEAVVTVKETDDYIAFTLEDFILTEKSYPLCPTSTRPLDFTAPPVESFRLVQLPVKNRANFGAWLNVQWDGSASVAVVATSPHALVDAEKRTGYRLMSAEAVREAKVRGTGAAIVVDRGDEAILDRMEALERDYGLPHGVRNRRNPLVNASIYFAEDFSPKTVDRHIELAKKGGFRLMQMSSWEFFGTTGDYEYNERYPNGAVDVKKVLDKVHAAGILPGLHILHTFIGFDSKLVKGGADRRLQLREHYTLARAVGPDDTEIFVDEDPRNAERMEAARLLKFGREIMSYEGFTTERPYRFTGVKRGVKGTPAAAHEEGQIGGTLWICEYGGQAIYVKQDSDLQDAFSARVAELWKAGLRFIYFDGSEGVCAPFGFHVPHAQFRMWKNLDPEPILGEGAAKAHFGWHMLSGANAFDMFFPEEFKAKIDEHPAAEAPLMKQDFSRVNFGWWGFWEPGAKICGKETIGVQPDMWEYGTAKAAAWDSPISVRMELSAIEAHPRLNDILEVMRRWEDVRVRKWLTPDMKERIRQSTRGFHLYLNDCGEYELCEITMLPESESAKGLRGFVFARNGRRTVAYWHMSGSGVARVALGSGGSDLSLPADNLRYLETDLSVGAVSAAFADARFQPSAQ